MFFGQRTYVHFPRIFIIFQKGTKKGEPTSRRHPSLNLNAKTKSKQKTQIMIISLLLLFFLLFIMSHKLTNKFKLSFSIFVKLLRRKYLLKLLVILLFPKINEHVLHGLLRQLERIRQLHGVHAQLHVIGVEQFPERLRGIHREQFQQLPVNFSVIFVR